MSISHIISLIPRPSLFLPFAFTILHKSRGAVKNTEGLPGLIHHMSGHNVDIGGEGLRIKFVCAKLESKFLTCQDK